MKKIALPLALAAAASLTAISQAHAGVEHKAAVAGCNDPSDIALYRRDDFYRAISSVDAGIGRTARYRLVEKTKYHYCRQAILPNKILPNEYAFCAEKLDNNDPNVDHPLRGFYMDLLYDTASGNGAAITPDQIHFNWNGRGNEGDTRCSAWYNVTNRHWMGMENSPYTKAWGHADIAQAVDDSYDWSDVDTGGRVHFFHPESDPDVS